MALDLTFLGAAGTVTGSRTLVNWRNQKFLVDAGLFQGDVSMRQRNWAPLLEPPLSVKDISFVLLTHAHLDHSGYLPRLYRAGFRGEILCSQGTADLCRILLLDAAHLEEEFAYYANITQYSVHKPALPLFTAADAEGALSLLSPQPRDKWLQRGENLSVRFLRAGHIIGASFIQLALQVKDQTKIITFSGDIGHSRSRFMRPPDDVLETDLLILESTYGDRLHDRNDVLDELAGVINRTCKRGGVLVIPAFAVGRAQELIYLIRILEDEKRIPTVPVILDSPMSAAATAVALKHTEDHLLASSFSAGIEGFTPHYFEITPTPNDSMLACMREGPIIVLSAAGMLNGGRILHHLKARLPDPKNTVLFAGYQAEGSKGRFLQDGTIDPNNRIGFLRIHHQEVAIEAEIATIASLSAHADYLDMLDWLRRIQNPPKQILLNHGTPESMQNLAEQIQRTLGIAVTCVTKPQTFSFW